MMPPSTLSVLVVEDNSGLREAIARFLEPRGCRVTTAANGVQGLVFVRHKRFDAVISDLNMPGRGGQWFHNQAVAVRPELRGRFVFISSEPRPDLQPMSLSTHSEHFLVKPLSLEALWRLVSDIVQGDGRSRHARQASTEESQPQSSHPDPPTAA